MVAHRLVAPPGGPQGRQYKALEGEVPTTPVIEDQGLSLVGSNCYGKKEGAAVAGPHNGAGATYEVSELPEHHTTLLARRHPIIATHWGLA